MPETAGTYRQAERAWSLSLAQNLVDLLLQALCFAGGQHANFEIGSPVCARRKHLDVTLGPSRWCNLPARRWMASQSQARLGRWVGRSSHNLGQIDGLRPSNTV